MRLTELKITNLRNLTQVSIKPSPTYNVIHGKNGCGKTSILEAIYLLGHGRSFRSHINKRIINYTAESLSVYANLLPIEDDDTETLQAAMPIAIQRHIDGSMELKMNGQKAKTIAELAKQLPILLLNPDSYQLLDSGPKFRRQFLDWGLFHVEHGYFAVWQHFQRALKQRNAAIRLTHDAIQVKLWDHELIRHAEQIHVWREQYFQELLPIFLEILEQLIDIEDLSLEYKKGWRKDVTLTEALQNNLEGDMALGHTQSGPQRGDVKVLVKGMPAQDILSRGQQKLIVAALRLAQGKLLKKLTDKSCIYLFDDLSAELDQQRLQNIINVISNINAQTFMTVLEAERLTGLLPMDQEQVRMFHVEQLLNDSKTLTTMA